MDSKVLFINLSDLLSIGHPGEETELSEHHDGDCLPGGLLWGEYMWVMKQCMTKLKMTQHAA